MAVKLDLRSRAIISFGDYASAVSEADIQKRMREISDEEMPEKPSKRGRKPTMTDGRTISVWLDSETVELAKEMASARQLSMSSFFRFLVRDAATPKIPKPNISTVGRKS